MASACVQCGRHVDPGRRCPYCGAYRPLPHRLLRLAAVLLAGIGLIALYLAARARPAAPVRIADITPLMGFANVTVTGRVTRAPFVGEFGDYVMFRVADGSGEIRVAAHDAVAEALLAGNRLPAAGDDIRISGELSISARRGARLYLRDADDVILAAIPGPATP